MKTFTFRRPLVLALAVALVVAGGSSACTLAPTASGLPEGGRRTPNTESTPRRAPAPNRPATANEVIAREVVDASNRARKIEGLNALETNEGIMRAAMDYAEELARREVIDHVSPTIGKSNPGERIKAAGVEWTRVGENLAEFSPRIGIAAASIEGWLNSPGHRHNLLNPLYRMTGAGVARDVNGYYYVVQVYATR